MFYCVSFQPHIRVERIALMDHYAAITQLQQLATFSPSYFILSHFLWLGQSILRQTLASCHFYLKDLDLKDNACEKWSGQNGKLKRAPIGFISVSGLFFRKKVASDQWDVSTPLGQYMTILTHFLLTDLLNPRIPSKQPHLPHSIFFISEMALTLPYLIPSQN